MNYTTKTTTAQYTAWLKTNPAISEVLRVQKQILAMAKNACHMIIGFCKRKKSRSFIWVSSPVKEPVSASAKGIRSTVFPQDWADQPDANYQYRCLKMQENLKQEIAMEQLHSEALSILISSK